VHYWVDLQSVHGFHCYDNIGLNTKCQRVLVLTLCLVVDCLEAICVKLGGCASESVIRLVGFLSLSWITQFWVYFDGILWRGEIDS